MKKRRQSRREIENRRLCFLVLYIMYEGEKKNVRPSLSGMETDEVAVQEVYFWGIR